MTVAKLIEDLKNLPQDYEIIVLFDSWTTTDPQSGSIVITNDIQPARKAEVWSTTEKTVRIK